MIPTVQTILYLGLLVGAFILQAWALISAISHSASSYRSADKRTKGFWLALLIPAAAIGFCSIPPPLGMGYNLMLLNIVAVVAAAVYLTDVRPQVRKYQRRRGSGGPRRPSSGGW